MSQMHWTYLDDRGGRHRVRLYHGSHSGHVMILCNGKVIVVDFNVLDTKKYSFLINDELCDLHLERKGRQFAYGLEINNEADTPANQRRRRRDRAHLVQSLLIAAVMFAVIGTSVFIMLGKGYF